MLSIGAWSLSTPLGAGAPDEPAQVIQSSAVVRGEFAGRQVPFRAGPILIGRIGTVEVPEWVTSFPLPNVYLNVPYCVAQGPHGSVSCETYTLHRVSVSTGTDTRTTLSGTQFSNYPPLYYLLVGVPTLLATGTGAFYGVRTIGVLVDSALIALGLFLLAHYHPRRLPLLGAMVALTPMVLFISAVVNTSGMETAAAFAAWCGGLCVVARTEVPRPLAALTSLPFFILILSRPISLFNAAVIVAVLATLAGWDRTRELIRNRSIRPIWVSALVATMVTVLMYAVFGLPTLTGAPEKPPLNVVGSLWLTLRLAGGQLRQIIGAFGWGGHILAPLWVIVAWSTALVGLTAYAVAVSQRCRRALLLLALAILAMPVIFESPQINSVGPYWQGRYWLPLTVGLPLVATSMEPRLQHRLARWAVPPSLQLAGFVSLGAILIVVQVGAFLKALHWWVGLTLTVEGFRFNWRPPGNATLAIGLFISGQILLLGFLTWQYLQKRSTIGFAPTVQSDALSR